MAAAGEQGVKASGLHIPESPVYGPGVHEPRGEPDHGGLRGGTLPSDPYRYDLKRPGAGPLHGGP